MSIKSNGLVTSASKGLIKIGMGLKKSSPEIMLAAGIVGGIAAAVLACKASTKLVPTLEKHEERVNDIHEKEKKIESGAVVSPEEENFSKSKELTKAYVKTGADLVRLYAPAATLGAVSIASILAGHNILRQRNVAIGAAYAAVNQSFSNYRDRVIKKYGKNVDKELLYDLGNEYVSSVVVDPDTGEEKVVEKSVVKSKGTDGYTFIFDKDHCYGFTKGQPLLNECTLRAQQNMANNRLQSKGYYYLYEALESLGFRDDMLTPEQRTMSHVVGWVFDEDQPIGDNYIDFNPMPVELDSGVGGTTEAYLLNFNVDGNILELMNRVVK